MSGLIQCIPFQVILLKNNDAILKKQLLSVETLFSGLV